MDEIVESDDENIW